MRIKRTIDPMNWAAMPSMASQGSQADHGGRWPTKLVEVRWRLDGGEVRVDCVKQTSRLGKQAIISKLCYHSSLHLTACGIYYNTTLSTRSQVWTV